MLTVASADMCDHAKQKIEEGRYEFLEVDNDTCGEGYPDPIDRTSPLNTVALLPAPVGALQMMTPGNMCSSASHTDLDRPLMSAAGSTGPAAGATGLMAAGAMESASTPQVGCIGTHPRPVSGGGAPITFTGGNDSGGAGSSAAGGRAPAKKREAAAPSAARKSAKKSVTNPEPVAYELLRDKNVAMNEAHLETLGIPNLETLAANNKGKAKESNKKKQDVKKKADEAWSQECLKREKLAPKTPVRTPNPFACMLHA